jgi:anti-sigma B factor antagonist
LTNVAFIDSSGLGALISGLKALRANGGDLVLCSMSRQVRTVFEITRLLRVFEVFEGPDPALEIGIGSLAAPMRAGQE